MEAATYLRLSAMKIWAWMVIGLLSTATADELADMKTEFTKQDKALNQVYAGLKKELRPSLFQTLQKNQRDWIEYRDYISDWQARDQEPAVSIERWETAAGLTESRVKWLEGWRLIDQREGWAGKYADSSGGWLEIVEKDGKFHFSLSVVRGPTFHLGEIRGELRVNGGTAWFEIQEDPEEAPTWLTFLTISDGSRRLQVHGENTHYFHGARAYFDGSYLWLGALSDEEKQQVIEGKSR